MARSRRLPGRRAVLDSRAATLRWIAFGVGVAAFGLAIRALAAGHLWKDRELAVTGPYAATRNPLYLGSALLALAFAIAGDSYWAGGLVLIYFSVFYYAVMRNEEADLKRRFGAIYEQYASRVPLFLPKFWGQTYGAQAPIRAQCRSHFPSRNTNETASIRHCWERWQDL